MEICKILERIYHFYQKIELENSSTLQRVINSFDQRHVLEYYLQDHSKQTTLQYYLQEPYSQQGTNQNKKNT